MATPPNRPQGALDDPRVYLAVERTFLAWIRTGLALMGFGFVVARFGLFLQELYVSRAPAGPAPHGVSIRFGTALVVLGAALNGTAVVRYVHLLRRLSRGETLYRPSRAAVAAGTALAVIGVLVSTYLMTSW